MFQNKKNPTIDKLVIEIDKSSRGTKLALRIFLLFFLGGPMIATSLLPLTMILKSSLDSNLIGAIIFAAVISIMILGIFIITKITKLERSEFSDKLLTKPQTIVWVYKSSVKYYGILEVNSWLQICFDDGKKYRLDLNGYKLDELINLFKTISPDALFGYHHVFESVYRKDPKALLMNKYLSFKPEEK